MRVTPAASEDGDVAQLGERRNGIAEVDGSIPFISTSFAFFFTKPERARRLWNSERMRFFCLFLVACSATVTRSDPESVAVLNGPTLIAFGGTTLYGASAGGVFQIAKASATPETIYQGSDSITDLVADDSNVYITRASTSEVGAKLRRLGAMTDLASNVQRGSLRQDKDTLYWFDIGVMPAALMRLAKAGGTATKVTDAGLTSSPDMAIDDTHVYWVDYTAPVTIKRVARMGGAPENVRVNVIAKSLQVDADTLFYLNGNPSAVFSLAKSGGEPEEVTKGADRFLVDNRYVYFTSITGETTKKQAIARVARTGRLLDVLIPDVGVTTTLQIVLGGGYLWWVDGKNLSRIAVSSGT